MKNISENLRKLGKEHKVVWTTDVENVYIETWTESREIDIGKVHKEIDELNAQIEMMPNEMMMPTNKEQLIQERNEKTAYLNSITPPAA